MQHHEALRSSEIDETRRAFVFGGGLSLLALLAGCGPRGASSAGGRSKSPNTSPAPLTPEQKAALQVGIYVNGIDAQLRKERLPSSVRSEAVQDGNAIMLINLEEAGGITSSLRITSTLDSEGHYQQNAVTKVEYAQVVNGTQQNVMTLAKQPGSRPAWYIKIQNGLVPEINTTDVTAHSYEQFNTAYMSATGNIQENIIAPAAIISAAR